MKRFEFDGLRETRVDDSEVVVRRLQGDVFAADEAGARAILRRRRIEAYFIIRKRNVRNIDRKGCDIRKSEVIFGGYWGYSPLAYLVA